MEALQVFEYEKLKVGERNSKGAVFTDSHLDALARYQEKHDVAWFSLIRNGIQFKNYVGVISLGDLTIEVLPKIDKVVGNETMWHNVLIDMLQTIGDLPVQASHSASLKRHKSSLLDLYFDLFLSEVELLIHRGLIKRYRMKEGNLHTLKGALQFNKHIANNLVHKERFYTRHTTYDQNHLIHAILLKALQVVANTTTTSSTKGKCGSLLLHFPEQEPIAVNQALFDRISYDRKSEPYRRALQIAELILLQYHPDIRMGRHELLAIVFDMNKLWEKWVLYRLKKDLPSDWEVRGQEIYAFYKKEQGQSNWRAIQPDIILKNTTDNTLVVWDTKWKIPKDDQSAIADIHQMHSYSQTIGFGAPANTALVYPGVQGHFSGLLHEKTSVNGTAPSKCDQIYLNVIEDGRLVKKLNVNWLEDILLGVI